MDVNFFLVFLFQVVLVCSCFLFSQILSKSSLKKDERKEKEIS